MANTHQVTNTKGGAATDQPVYLLALLQRNVIGQHLQWKFYDWGGYVDRLYQPNTGWLNSRQHTDPTRR